MNFYLHLFIWCISCFQYGIRILFALQILQWMKVIAALLILVCKASAWSLTVKHVASFVKNRRLALIIQSDL